MLLLQVPPKDLKGCWFASFQTQKASYEQNARES